jgi:hypothetical protein
MISPILWAGYQQTHFHAMHQTRSSQIPIDEAWNGSNRVQSKPKHQVPWAIAPIHSNHLIYLYAKVIYQPIPHSCKSLEELFVRPCLAFKDEEGMVGLFANLVFEDMVGKNAFSDGAIGNEIYNIL